MLDVKRGRDWIGGTITKIRDYVNGNTDIGEAIDPYNRARSAPEEFIVRIIAEVKKIIQREQFRPPGERIYIPLLYVVYLSHADDQAWQGQRRAGLERGLSNSLAEFVSQLGGDEPLQNDSVLLELRVDGTLKKGQFRVQHYWDDTARNQTVVTTTHIQPPTPIYTESTVPEVDRDITLVRDTDRDITLVRIPAGSELYSVEVWRDGTLQRVVPIAQESITIGRGSRAIPVDLAITGDPEVSRHHATLTLEDQTTYRLSVKGRNTVVVAGKEVKQGTDAVVIPGELVEIGSFKLRIVPKKTSESVTSDQPSNGAQEEQA